MAIPTETSTKRPLDDADDCQLDEFKKPKYPPPKIRTGVQFFRDFPPGCGTIHDSLQAERKPLKKLDNLDSNIPNKFVNSHSSEGNKLNTFKPKELGLNKPSSTSKPSSKVKFYDPMEQVVRDFPPVSGIIDEKKPSKNQFNVDSNLESSKHKKLGLIKHSFAKKSSGKVKYYDPTNDVKIMKDANSIDSRRREKIIELMILFDKIYTHLHQENGSKQKGEIIAHCRVPTESANIVKQKSKWMSPEKSLGQIRGVHLGDKFKFRAQLQLIGLHNQPHCGIDYTKINGKNIALSIVDSHRYSNESDHDQSSDVLSYCGEGGGGGSGVHFGFSGGNKRQVAPDDQKLERGNLALKNSMIEKSPVRVIKKVFGKMNNDLFVYDGLYTVKECIQKRGNEGKMVFMFQLHKMSGQDFQNKVDGYGGMRGNVGSQHYSTFHMPF